MKKLFLLQAFAIAFSIAHAQKVIKLDPGYQICYHPGTLFVNLTGSVNDSTFQIYYEISDTAGLVFERGNKDIPVLYFALFMSNADPEALQQVLLAFNLHMKLDD